MMERLVKIMAKHKSEDEVTISFTRKQAEWLLSLVVNDYNAMHHQGTEFAARRRLARALGKWKEKPYEKGD